MCRSEWTSVLACFFCISAPILLVTLLFLYVNPHNPAFSVEEFYVPAFNRTANNATSSTISFNIKLKNRNKAIGLYYVQPLNLTVSYITKLTNEIFIWQYSVPRFYQGNKQSRRLVDEIQMLGENVSSWNRVVEAERAWIPRSRVMMTLLEPLQFFRFDIIAKVRFRLIGNHHGKVLVVSGLVPIQSNTGQIFTLHAVRLSVASRVGWGVTQVVVLLVSTALTTVFL